MMAGLRSILAAALSLAAAPACPKLARHHRRGTLSPPHPAGFSAGFGMRAPGIVLLLMLLGAGGACAEGTRARAGIIRLTVEAATPFDALVWYPTEAEELPWQAGPFSIPATRDAAPAAGPFPVILLSHGGGLGGGTPLTLRESAAALARQGFVVIAPFHGKTGLRNRMAQVVAALDRAQADARLKPHLDSARLGMLGFSLGTAVTLQLAGAVPNPAHFASYCAAHPADAMSCANAPDGRNGTEPGQARPTAASAPSARLPLKAIALLDPYAVMFQRPELAAVTLPVSIFRPDQSEMPGEANATGLAAGLPRVPDFHVIPGRHFVFIDTCPEPLRLQAPEVCEDPPGVDRAAVHRAVEAELVAFFRKHL